MKVVFRCDASLEIGTGHVMRCLTLAQGLTELGHTCEFICREHVGSLIDVLKHKGFQVHTLALKNLTDERLAHSDWLGATQADDCMACLNILRGEPADWLVVDHYALDVDWEKGLSEAYRHLLVIDDLADREHCCDLLIDQTFGRQVEEYEGLVPAQALLLCGASYALLRPEFKQLRAASLERRKEPMLRRLLVNLGGVDQNNLTAQILKKLDKATWPADFEVTVVMGHTAPNLESVKEAAESTSFSCEVLMGVSNMAELMAACDLAIGAAGSTSWERCCLGLPTLMLVLAANQEKIAQLLVQGKAAVLIKDIPAELNEAVKRLQAKPERLLEMSSRAQAVTDGLGIERVVEKMQEAVSLAN